MPINFIDETGNTYGRLTVVDRAANIGKATMWNCLCECGNEKAIRAISLRSGRTKSCGCLNRESSTKRATTHGLSDTREYSSWYSMKDRCLNTHSDKYSYYGGRGITICQEWVESFEQFYSDMGSRPEGMSIERIDNDKGYYPENCKWATLAEQANNKRNNVILELDGLVQTVAQWANHLGISYNLLAYRLRILPAYEALKPMEVSI